MTDYWCWGIMVAGYGFVIPFSNINTVNITSAKIFANNNWTTVPVSEVSKTLLQDKVVLDAGSAYSAGAQYGQAYLCALTGSVS